MKLILTYLFLFISVVASARGKDTVVLSASKDDYERAFEQIKGLLNEKKPDFKKAVFITENCFYNNKAKYEDFNKRIEQIANLCLLWKQTNKLNNNFTSDSVNVSLNACLFHYITDTVKLFSIKNNEAIEYKTVPYSYDFDDFFGQIDWQKMFVLKLLDTHKGNCHSLPYLYYILANEIGAKCWLSMAPNHIYIKNYSKQSGWYNTELTSREFPTDGWVMASGYVTLEAVQNGIFMDTLSLKQAVALTLVDLAKGYQKKNKTDLDFIIKCCDESLTHFPNNPTAIVLRGETIRKKYDSIENKDSNEAKELYTSIEKSYVALLKKGYREMPESMYLDWLNSLKKEREKFINKKIINFNKVSK